MDAGLRLPGHVHAGGFALVETGLIRGKNAGTP